MFGHDNNDDDQNDNNMPVANADATSAMPAPDAALDSTSTMGSPALPSSEPSTDLPSASTSSDDTSVDDLISVKQQVLQDLSPLVSHLDQTPEERFKTMMMMLQATDDKTLVKSAYDAAKQITDDKARAQALLDVVNEINYFTQPHHDD